MMLNKDEKLEILKLEMGLLQSTLDKYDDLIYRNRNWFITLWAAMIGLSFTNNIYFLPLFGIGLALVYWLLEGVLRYKSWYKNVNRYREIRDALNSKDFDINQISIYDLTNKYGKQEYKIGEKISACFFRMEAIFLYLIMVGASLVIYFIINK